LGINSGAGHTDAAEALAAALSRVDYRHPAVPAVRETLLSLLPTGRLPEDLRVGVIRSGVPNAFAIGQKTLAVTEGLLQAASAEELAGVAGHELGHLAHGDGVALARIVFMYAPGSWAASLINWVAWVTGNVVARMGPAGWFMGAAIYYPWLLMARVLNFATTAVVMKNSRDAEYAADRYAAEVSETCRAGLVSFLEKLAAWEAQAGRRPGGLVAALLASHPPTAERIARLRGAA